MKKQIAVIILSLYLGTNCTYDIEQALSEKNVLPVVVLGSGPAGWTAAMQTVRAAIPTIVIAGPQAGGQLIQTNNVDNFPGIKKVTGTALSETMAEQAIAFGAQYHEDIVTEIDFSQWPFLIKTEKGLKLKVLAVIIATGAEAKRLGVPGEEKYFGNGVSPCALCDCLLYKDKTVFVVGGGDAAIEEAFQLAPLASSVTVLVRSQHMRAAKLMQERLKDSPKIAIHFAMEVLEVLGDGETVTGLRLRNTLSGQQKTVQADGLFLAIGQTPNTNLFKNQISLKPSGHIRLQPGTQETSIPGVYACGDVEDDQFRQAIISAGRGGQAGLECVRWLREIGYTQQ